MQARANKDVIKVTLTQYELEQARKNAIEFQNFLNEMLSNIDYAERRFRINGDSTFRSITYDQWLKRSK